MMAKSDVYPVSTGWKVLLVLRGLALIAVGVGWIAFTCKLRDEIDDAALVVAVCFPALSILIGLSGIIRALLLPALVLTPQALRVPGLIRDMRILKSRMTGYCAAPGRLLPIVEVNVARPDGSIRQFRVSLPFKPDAALAAWWADIPEVDAPRRASASAQTEADARQGAAPALRVAHQAGIRRMTDAATVAVILICAWAICSQSLQFWSLGALALLPPLVLALCWLSRARFSIGEVSEIRTERADLGLLLAGPAISLFIVAARLTAHFSFMNLLLPAGLGMIPLLAIAAHVIPYDPGKPSKRIALNASLLMYCVGGSALGNVLLGLAA